MQTPYKQIGTNNRDSCLNSGVANFYKRQTLFIQIRAESGQIGMSPSQPNNTIPSEFLCTNLLENSNSVSMLYKKKKKKSAIFNNFKQWVIPSICLTVDIWSYGCNSNLENITCKKNNLNTSFIFIITVVQQVFLIVKETSKATCQTDNESLSPC